MNRLCLLGLLAILLVFCRLVPVAADDKPQWDVPKLLKRFDQVERELQRLKLRTRFTPAAERTDPVLALIEHPYLGISFTGSARGTRFFAVRLICLNRRSESITIDRDAIKFTVDGAVFPIEALPSSLRYHAFQVGGQSYTLGELKSPKRLEINAGEAKATWVIVPNLPPGNQVPHLTLAVSTEHQAFEVDINEFCRGLLQLEERRLGPYDSLALFTISGELNTINLGHLVDEIDQLALQDVVRVVLNWTDEATSVDPAIENWLVQTARGVIRGNVQRSQFPVFPATIRELHLVQGPKSSSQQTSAGSSSALPTRFAELASGLVHNHATLSEAVMAALWSAYQRLPRERILLDIQMSDPLICSAALAAGAGRLGPESLPLILQKADDADLEIQRAALMALRHFGEPPAIDKLVQYASTSREPLTSTAVDSLAESRFAAAHHALLTLLEHGSISSQKTIVHTLAYHPRLIWSDTLYEFAQERTDDVAVEALQALIRIGHPHLYELLEKALGSENSDLRDLAFNELLSRADAPSQKLLLNFTLHHLEDSLPTPKMYGLLNRTKDPRAIPLLLKHLKDSEESRASLINTLSLIGGSEVADALDEQYEDLPSAEQAAVLRALYRLQSPHFLKRAKAALYSDDTTLVRTACQTLQADQRAAATHLLVEALETSSKKTTWSYLCNTLTVVATADARKALRKARDSDNADKHNYALAALRNLEMRSPGSQFVNQGRAYSARKDSKTAAEYYSLALEIDSELPSAYSGRGNCYLLLDDVAKARKDYQKAVELDPYDSIATTGLAIAKVREGDSEGGIQLIEKLRTRFAKDVLFSYNAACVYGRALEQVSNDPETADSAEKKKTYAKKAVWDLRRSIKQGFDDLEWLKADPDLQSLHGRADFQQLLDSMSTKPG